MLAAAGGCGPARRPGPPALDNEAPSPDESTRLAGCVGDGAAACLPRVALRLLDGAWLQPHELQGRVVVVVPAWSDDALGVEAAAEVLAQLDPGGHRTTGLVAPRARVIGAAHTRNDRATSLRVLDEFAGARLGIDGNTALAIYDQRGTLALRQNLVVDRLELRAVVLRLLTPP